MTRLSAVAGGGLGGGKVDTRLIRGNENRTVGDGGGGG